MKYFLKLVNTQEKLHTGEAKQILLEANLISLLTYTDRSEFQLSGERQAQNPDLGIWCSTIKFEKYQNQKTTQKEPNLIKSSSFLGGF